MLKSDRGIYRSPGHPDAVIATAPGSIEYGGNLELLPPTGKHELGRISVGKDMSEKKRQFLQSQEVQPRLNPDGSAIDLDTNWLAVGHVDDAAPPYQNIKKVNELVQAKVNDAKGKIETAALQANDMAEDVAFKFVPVLYTGRLAGTVPESLADRKSFAWAPGAANIQFGYKPAGPNAGNKLFVARQNVFHKEGTPPMDVEEFGPAISAELGGLGAVVFVDDFAQYHAAFGEVHCGSNVLRQTYDFQWWTRNLSFVPNLPPPP